MNNNIVIVGAGGHGKVIADIAKLNGYRKIVFLDDDIKLNKSEIYSVHGTTRDIPKYKDKFDFIIAIGNNQIRKNITLQLNEQNIEQAVLIHPSAIIDSTVHIEEGTVIMANAVINAECKIGKGVIINTGSTVDHDCVIEDFTHICPGVHIAGTVKIGRYDWIGIGANIINNISICNDVIIGAGSTVIQNINDRGTYVGSPVKKVK